MMDATADNGVMDRHLSKTVEAKYFRDNYFISLLLISSLRKGVITVALVNKCYTVDNISFQIKWKEIIREFREFRYLTDTMR